MSTIYNIALGIHILCVVAILAMLLTQVKKSPKNLNPGILHATLTALIVGLVMVGLFKTVNTDEVLNHTKIGIKFLVLVGILVLGYKNVKKPELKGSIWATMMGLTIFNVLIASFWN